MIRKKNNEKAGLMFSRHIVINFELLRRNTGLDFTHYFLKMADVDGVVLVEILLPLQFNLSGCLSYV